jgi:hypothetical protein
METVPQVCTALRQVLVTTANRAAWQTGFVRRRSSLTGARFVQTLVFGFLRSPQASRSELACTAAQVGAPVTAQGVDQRFGERAAACLRLVLEAAAQAMVTAAIPAVPLLQRFGMVAIQDSTTITLPDVLAAVWPGCGGRVLQGSQAALKLQVRLDVCRGQLRGPELHPGRAPDQAGALAAEPAPAGGLQVRDLGYFHLERLCAEAAAGGY